MKKIVFILASLFAFGAFTGGETAKAQVVSININIGTQPAWGPVGYDYVDFYYIPEIDCYYDVPRGLFFYIDRGRWVGARYLPAYYSRYDLYRLHKVVVNGYRNPWMYNRQHHTDYRRYIGRYNQPIIRYSNDHRYDVSRRNRYDWVENGQNLHTRSTRTYSEGRSSSSQGRSNARRASESSSQDRQNVNSGRTTSTGRSSSSSTQSAPRQQQQQRERPQSTQSSSSGRGSNSSSNSSSSRSSEKTPTARQSSSSSRGSSSSSTRSSSSSSSNSSRGSNTERPASNR